MATYTAIAAGGNWSSNATWGGAGHPVAGDTANINAIMTGTVTVDGASACAVLNLTNNGGTLAFGNNVITVTGNVTLGGTITAGSGGLNISSTSAMNSGGITFPGTLELSGTTAKTLTTNNWVNTGLVTFSGVAALNGTGLTLTCNGGATAAAVSNTGTAKLIIGGGTLQSTNDTNTFTNDINLAGNITIGTYLTFKTKTLTYVSGIIDTSTNTSTLTIRGNCTLNTPTANMHWYNLSVSGSYSITLTNDITVDQDLTPLSGNISLLTSNVTVGGNLTVTGGVVGNITIKMTGTGTGTPTWSGNGQVVCNLSFDAPGETITISGSVTFTERTLTYIAGTIITTGSTITSPAGANFNLSTMHLNNLHLSGNSYYTLFSDLVIDDELQLTSNATISGSYNISCANFNSFPVDSNVISIFRRGQTLTVTNSMNISGNGVYTNTIKSDVESPKYLNYTGTAANCSISNAIFTWIDASGSAQILDNWYGGTLTNTVNIRNLTSANTQGVFGII